MKGKLLLVVLLLSIGIIECIAQFCLKKVYLGGPWPLYAVAFVCYAAVCVILVQSYKYETMGLTNVLWNGVSTVLIFLVGIMFFQERLTGLDIVGTVLVMGGIACILWENGK